MTGEARATISPLIRSTTSLVFVIGLLPPRARQVVRFSRSSGRAGGLVFIGVGACTVSAGLIGVSDSAELLSESSPKNGIWLPHAETTSVMKNNLKNVRRFSNSASYGSLIGQFDGLNELVNLWILNVFMSLTMQSKVEVAETGLNVY